jgi:hypothetical protein
MNSLKREAPATEKMPQERRPQPADKVLQAEAEVAKRTTEYEDAWAAYEKVFKERIANTHVLDRAHWNEDAALLDMEAKLLMTLKFCDTIEDAKAKPIKFSDKYLKAIEVACGITVDESLALVDSRSTSLDPIILVMATRYADATLATHPDIIAQLKKARAISDECDKYQRPIYHAICVLKAAQTRRHNARVALAVIKNGGTPRFKKAKEILNGIVDGTVPFAWPPVKGGDAK